MSDTFKLVGSYATEPSGASSGDPLMTALVEEQLVLKTKTYREYVLQDDAVQVVDFGGVDAAHVVVVKTVGGRATMRLTRADDEDEEPQAIPVDSFAAVISESEPFSAMDLQREAGIEVTVKIFVGEKA